MKNLIFLFLSVPFFLSCNSTVNGIFGKKRTPHEAYAEKIEKQPSGQAWLEVSNSSLLAPKSVKLPYSQIGYFPADRPRALTLQFSAKRGEQLNFNLYQKNSEAVQLFADVFKKEADITSHILSAELSDTSFGFVVTETGEYLLRLQPQLDAEIEYNLSASTMPSLGFPVSGSKGRVGSVWGDSRDGGKRNHEGIDIFAAKRTPVVAAADGYITSVKNGGLGGKTVNLRVSEQDLSLYYAHLDEQWVQPGQSVKKGDTLGLVGNTGNAKHTPPHLHFGIYTYGGAIDPLPFVNPVKAKSPILATGSLPGLLKLTRVLKTTTNGTIQPNTVLVPLALTANGYIAELPGGGLIEAPIKSVKSLETSPGS